MNKMDYENLAFLEEATKGGNAMFSNSSVRLPHRRVLLYWFSGDT